MDLEKGLNRAINKTNSNKIFNGISYIIIQLIKIKKSIKYNIFIKSSFYNKYSIFYFVNQLVKYFNLLSIRIFSPKELAYSIDKYFHLMLNILNFKTIQHELLELRDNI